MQDIPVEKKTFIEEDFKDHIDNSVVGLRMSIEVLVLGI